MTPSGQRHAVLRVAVPQGWTPRSPEDVPPALVVLDNVALDEAARRAVELNAGELRAPSGAWYVAAKSLRKRNPRRTRRL